LSRSPLDKDEEVAHLPEEKYYLDEEAAHLPDERYLTCLLLPEEG